MYYISYTYSISIYNNIYYILLYIYIYVHMYTEREREMNRRRQPKTSPSCRTWDAYGGTAGSQMGSERLPRESLGNP